MPKKILPIGMQPEKVEPTTNDIISNIIMSEPLSVDTRANIASIPEISVKPGYVQITDLPSKFAFYPTNTKIFVRKFTTAECKTLVDIFNNDEQNFNQTLNGILLNAMYGINIDELIRKDRFYIVLYILVMTYPTGKFYLPWACNHCSTDNKYSLNLEDVEVTDFDISNKITDIIADEATFDYFPCTIGRDKIIETMITTYGEDRLDITLLEIIKNVSSINGISHPVEMYNMLSDMPAADPVIMLATIEDYDFGVIPSVHVQCSHCKEAANLALRFHGTLFMPSVIRSK